MFLQIFLNYATMRSSFAGAFRCHFSFFGSHVLKFDTLIPETMKIVLEMMRRGFLYLWSSDMRLLIAGFFYVH